VNYYKLETVKRVLHTEYGASCVSVARPRGEAWARVVNGHRHLAMLGWDRDEQILSELEVHYIATALRVGGEELVARVRANGGLWLGPTPR
jgi:hypothetical protein